MYLGGGLTWHFPCSHNCSNTCVLINQRFEQLKKMDYGLANRLLENQKQAFYLTNNRRIHIMEDICFAFNLKVNII